jgi:hypothetical protein
MNKVSPMNTSHTILIITQNANDHATRASPKGNNKASLAHDANDRKEKKLKKKRGFWARIWGCFNPDIVEHKLAAHAHVGRPTTGNAAYAKKADDDDKAESNQLTDETAVHHSVASPPALHSPPHLSIPAAPVVITAPSTPAYNSFDLDPDPDVVIPPTPKGSHLLPVDETEGVTSGAVQPPGSLAHTDRDETDAGNFTDDEFHDAKEEEDIDAEEMRLVMNAGSGIPIVDGKPKPLLPALAERHQGRKCLVRFLASAHSRSLTYCQVLDMDETLLHSSFKESSFMLFTLGLCPNKSPVNATA